MPFFRWKKHTSQEQEQANKDSTEGAEELLEELPEIPLTQEEASAESKKPDLIEYLQSLPEVEDTFEPFEEDEPIVVEQTQEGIMADFIRERTLLSMVTASQLLKESFENYEELILKMLETCEDIACVDGEKDKYYYCNATMTANYAMIAMLIEDKNMPRTIAQMVRERATYPAATPCSYFLRSPYNWTKTQLNNALVALSKREEYADIVQVNAFNGEPYLYSRNHLSDKYGKALANYGEEKVE